MRKRLTTKTLLALGVVGLVLAAPVLWNQYEKSSYPRFRLGDGSEFRVVKITYTSTASDSTEHNLGGSLLLNRLWGSLPSAIQSQVPEPSRGVGSTSSPHPSLSIWWARFDPKSHQSLFGEVDDILVTMDSGQTKRLFRPEAELAQDNVFYWQIFVVDVPSDSQYLTFEVPIDDETSTVPVPSAHFTIKNPAFRK
jgi:hypothetical protein